MDMSLYERQAVAAVADAWAKAFAPRVRLTVSEWADQNRVLTSAESSRPGPWRTDVVPYIREIMDSLGDGDPCQMVAFMKPTQVAGSEALLNWAGYAVDHSPGPMMLVQSTIEMAELFSKQRITNMIAGCEVLSAKIPPGRSRDGGNTTLLKTYPGGVMRLSGANSAASLRSMPVGKLGMDEVDAYEDDVGGEGSPIKLALERTNNFPRRKVFLCSTPTVKGASNIEHYFLLSDQRRYHVPCPHCGHMQHLQHSRFKYHFAEGGEGDPEQLLRVVYVCESCEQEIEEHHKTRMLAAGKWVPTYPDRKIKGYHLNSYYSPIGLGKTWFERAEEFLRAKNNPVLLKSFINTALGETWEDQSSSLKSHELSQRALPYNLRTIPAGVLLLTAGIDTQDDRLEMYVWGWGRNGRRWLIDFIRMEGNPESPPSAEQPNVWQQLTGHLEHQYTNVFGMRMPVEAAALDTAGHNTQAAYRFVRRWRGRCQLKAIIGRSGKALVSTTPSKVDVAMNGTTIKDGLKLWTVGVDDAKSSLYGALLADREQHAAGEALQVNFSQELDDDFYEQLTSELYDAVNKRWRKKKGVTRNEALDCANYAQFAAFAPPLRIGNAPESYWDERERYYQPLVQDMFESPPSAATAQPPAVPASPANRGASSLVEPENEMGLPDPEDYWK